MMARSQSVARHLTLGIPRENRFALSRPLRRAKGASFCKGTAVLTRRFPRRRMR